MTVPLPFVWRTPETSFELVLLVSIALIAAVAEIMVIKALDVADAVVVAPVHYSIIIWATFFGFMVFDQLPDMWTWVGASSIVVMGAYTLHRDWRLKSFNLPPSPIICRAIIRWKTLLQHPSYHPRQHF